MSIGLVTIAYGALSGAGFAIYGYAAKKAGKKGLGFKPVRLLKTVCVGAVIGSIASYQGVTIDTLWEGGIFVTITGFVDKGINAIIKLLKR